MISIIILVIERNLEIYSLRKFWLFTKRVRGKIWSFSMSAPLPPHHFNPFLQGGGRNLVRVLVKISHLTFWFFLYQLTYIFLGQFCIFVDTPWNGLLKNALNFIWGCFRSWGMNRKRSKRFLKHPVGKTFSNWYSSVNFEVIKL